MTVLVTGATGHLGSNIVRALLKSGRNVRAMLFQEAPTALEGLDVELVHGSLLDRASLDAAVRGVEVVYQVAAFVSINPSDAARLFATNVEGPRNVAEACRAHGVRRLVHVSSIHALATPPEGAVTDESLPPNLDPRAPAYDRSKALGEREIQKAVELGLDAVIVNPTGILGPFAYQPQLHVRALLDIYFGSLPALVRGGFNWVDSRDVAAGALAAETKGRRGERYLLSGHWHSLEELARTVEAVTGKRAPRTTLPIWMAKLGVPFIGAYASLAGVQPLYTVPSIRALREHRHCSNEKARRELGYSARPLEQTISDTFEYFRRVGLLERGEIRATSMAAAGLG